MRIETLELRNYRGIAMGVFRFPRAEDRVEVGGSGSFNLVIGENGAGKTSVLEGLATAASYLFSGIRGVEHRRIESHEFHTPITFVQGRAVAVPTFPARFRVSGSLDGQAVDWDVTYEGDGSAAHLPGCREIMQISQKMGMRLQNLRDTMPILAVYGTDRNHESAKKIDPKILPGSVIMGEASARPKLEIETAIDQFKYRLAAYSHAMEASSRSTDLIRWMAVEDYRAYQTDHESVLMKMVLDAIGACLPGIKDVFFSKNLQTLVFSTEETSIAFHHLSEGQRGIVALVGDLAWRAAQLNPHLAGRALAETPGMVIIDELDLHLHPAWQRTIVRSLQAIFPEIQFVCSTHSPQIVGEAYADEVLILGESEPYTPDKASGLDSNRVLEEIMGGHARRSEEAKLLNDLARSIDDEDFGMASNLIDQLKAKFGENDPMVVEHQTFLDFLKSD